MPQIQQTADAVFVVTANVMEYRASAIGQEEPSDDPLPPVAVE